MNMSDVVDEIAKVVGDQNVSDDPEIQYLYHYDFITAEPEGLCDIVVMPDSAEDVQEIVKIANKYKIPVVPWVSGINFGSTATPIKGGIVIDMRRMNRVLEVNEDDMYVLVEGGITWADLKGYLDKNHPDLRAGYTWSPPGTGVVASCLCYGMFDLGMIGGTGAEFINGMEAVLGSGDIVKIGSCSVSNCWHGRAPFPDLAGLFIGWEGSTGIVTKAAIKIWPKLPFRTDYTVIALKMEIGIPVMLKLSKAGLGIIDLCVVNIGWGQSLQHLNEKTSVKDAIEAKMPDFYGTITTQAYTKKQSEAQNEAIVAICKEGGVNITESPEGTSTGGDPTPMQFWGCWNYSRGGGGQWIGSYCSNRDIVKYYNLSRDVCLKYGHPPQFYSRLLFGGHYCVSRTNINFNKNDPKEIEEVQQLLKELHEDVHSIDGVIMYKAPKWAHERIEKKMNPGTTELIKKIRKIMDPNGIMNPGHGWGE